MTKSLGQKITCKKCKSKYYTLENKRLHCPVCEKNNLIPDATVLRVKLRIRPGGFNDSSQGWTDGYASRGKSGSIYLNCEYTVVGGEYTGKKIFSLIGLKSLKGPWWANKGRGLIRGILNAAHGISEKDTSQNAIKARRVSSFKDIDGLQFFVRVKIVKNQNGRFQNDIGEAIAPDESEHQQVTASLKMKDVSSKLSGRSSIPMWMQ